MSEAVHTSPTIGSNVEEVKWKNFHFIMWDLGGQESLRSAWSTYYTNTEVSTFLLLAANLCLYGSYYSNILLGSKSIFYVYNMDHVNLVK